MKNLKKFSLSVVVALAMPFAANASSLIHDVGGEAGFTFHPEHVVSTKSRGDVAAEIEAARKDGTLVLLQRGIPLPAKMEGAAKTRSEVITELNKALSSGFISPSGDR